MLTYAGIVLTYTKDFRHLSADENLQSPVYFQTYLEPVLKELYALGYGLMLSTPFSILGTNYAYADHYLQLGTRFRNSL